jgi:hypothetical protein
MKYTIASLIASLYASEVKAQFDLDFDFFNFFDTKKAWCHYAEDMRDWSKPRMLFDLFQTGPDESPQSFKFKMQAYNMGKKGDTLTVNRFDGEDCESDGTSVVDDGVRVKERWGKSRARYRTFLDETSMCDFGSIQVADSEGN